MNAGFGFTEQKSVCFLTYLKFGQLFHELMNQYQACLYLFQCISHGDSKYGHEIPKCCNFWNFWPCRVHSPAAWKALNCFHVQVTLRGTSQVTPPRAIREGEQLQIGADSWLRISGWIRGFSESYVVDMTTRKLNR